MHTRTVAGRCWEAGSLGLAEGRPATGPQDVGLNMCLARLLHKLSQDRLSCCQANMTA